MKDELIRTKIRIIWFNYSIIAKHWVFIFLSRLTTEAVEDRS